MAITEQDYLLVYQNPIRGRNNDHCTYLLLRSPTHLHLIHDYTSQTPETWDQFLAAYPCDTAQLKSMGYTVTAYPLEPLCQVTALGTLHYDNLDLDFSPLMLCYALAEHYTEEDLARFFQGIPLKIDPPQWNGLPPKLVRLITFLLTTLAIATVIGMWLYLVPIPSKWMIALVLLQLAVIVVLPFLAPNSFTLLEAERMSRYFSHPLRGDFFFAFLSLFCALLVASLQQYYLNRHLWPFFSVCNIVFLILTRRILRKEQIRLNQITQILLAGFLCCMFLWTVPMQLNYVLDFHEPVEQTLRVETLTVEEDGLLPTYFCTASDTNGNTMEFEIPFLLYGHLEPGDKGPFRFCKGAFGIPYILTGYLYYDPPPLPPPAPPLQTP